MIILLLEKISRTVQRFFFDIFETVEEEIFWIHASQVLTEANAGPQLVEPVSLRLLLFCLGESVIAAAVTSTVLLLLDAEFGCDEVLENVDFVGNKGGDEESDEADSATYEQEIGESDVAVLIWCVNGGARVRISSATSSFILFGV